MRVLSIIILISFPFFGYCQPLGVKAYLTFDSNQTLSFSSPNGSIKTEHIPSSKRDSTNVYDPQNSSEINKTVILQGGSTLHTLLVTDGKKTITIIIHFNEEKGLGGNIYVHPISFKHRIGRYHLHLEKKRFKTGLIEGEHPWFQKIFKGKLKRL
jgi:hypothetical protein